MPEVYLSSYNYRGYSFGRALRQCREYGYDGVELWAGHYQIDSVEATLQAALPRATALGVSIPVLNLSGNVIGDDAAEREARISRFAEVLERVGDAGIRLINGYAGSLIVDRDDWGKNGSSIATTEHYRRAVNAYQRLGAVAGRVGIVVTLEIHMNTIHDTAASAARLIDQIGSPNVRINYDPGNMYGTPTSEPALEAIDIAGDRIAYTHFKNARRAPALPVGVDYHVDLANGDLDYFSIVRALMRRGYAGPYTIEYSGGGDRSVPSRNDVQYLRRLFSDVARELQDEANDEVAEGGGHVEPL